MTPTQRSLKLLRDAGYRCAIVERWNQYARIRQDLWGFCDLLCYHPTTGQIMFIQTTSGANVAARLAKLRANEHAVSLARHYRVEVHGWAKRGARGKRKMWSLRIETMTGDER